MPEKTLQKILLVDDDPECLQIMAIVLEDKYILELAKSGEEALALVEEFRPDLVVLDVMETGMSGFEVSRLLRKIDLSGKMKIIFTSAKEFNIENWLEIKTHRYGFFQKPFDLNILENQIESMLRLDQIPLIERINAVF